MQELLANEAVLTTAITIIGLLVVWGLEKVTKKDINPEGEKNIKGIVSRIVIALVGMIRKKK